MLQPPLRTQTCSEMPVSDSAALYHSAVYAVATNCNIWRQYVGGYSSIYTVQWPPASLPLRIGPCVRLLTSKPETEADHPAASGRHTTRKIAQHLQSLRHRHLGLCLVVRCRGRTDASLDHSAGGPVPNAQHCARCLRAQSHHWLAAHVNDPNRFGMAGWPDSMQAFS